MEVDAGILFALALVASSLGFYRLVYFVSLGYGLSMLGMAVAVPLRFSDALGPATLAHCMLLGLYGLRLATYLVSRERQPAYRRELADVNARATGIGPLKKLGIWCGVSLLYVFMFSPAVSQLLGARGGAPTAWTEWLGLGVMVAGLGLESLADAQKSAYKKAHPDRFCDVKLFRLVRCPNYLGEVIFWLGNFTAAVLAYQGPVQWGAAVIGLVCIVLIMMGSTKRLEHKQDTRYGAREDYQAWIRSVPVLFPLVPVYSLKRVRVVLE